MNIIHLNPSLVKAMLPSRRENSAKWDYGRVLCVVGSQSMPGAAGLVCSAALVSGVGLVRLASVEPVCFAASCQLMECTLLILPQGPQGTIGRGALPLLLREAERATALVVGCGLGVSDDTRELVSGLVAHCAATMVLDADALNILAEDPSLLKQKKGEVILTPHIYEFSRVVDKTVETVMNAKKALVVELSERYGITVVLKGAETIIAGKGSLWKNSLDNPGLAKGGSGDVLAGLMGGLAAQGILPEHAAASAVYLHARAGALARQQLGVYGMTAGTVSRLIPQALGELAR